MKTIIKWFNYPPKLVKFYNVAMKTILKYYYGIEVQ